MRLFCLPYAGGSASAYYKWKNYLSDKIVLEPIELKGRGKRFNEPFYSNFEEVIEDVYGYISDNTDSDYAIFGHSMGSLIAYELYYKIQESNMKKPKHLFFSSYKAPHNKRNNLIKKLTDQDLINRIRNLGGTQEELLQNEEFLDIYLPIIRNDFELINSYTYSKKANQILCDITLLYGNEEVLKFEDMLDWQSHSQGKSTVYELEGNHFYINDNIEQISDILNRTLLE
ncbi:Surfactin synthase thioesterase subunit [Gracilibacillus orientalis]|uniref:Surfactin synthase thioesterase subunit n=1 Tax=Gracilibacillus orientalis TaxID=334253 RepID=A0A1I4H5J1_9BACI|nr:thioesterase domain-containing protein [Gracilibacillus orientalis]SFL37548.1 Surfactin synthase thioesterase subunit [Gracilibacillus orientalis]